MTTHRSLLVHIDSPSAIYPLRLPKAWKQRRSYVNRCVPLAEITGMVPDRFQILLGPAPRHGRYGGFLQHRPDLMPMARPVRLRINGHALHRKYRNRTRSRRNR